MDTTTMLKAEIKALEKAAKGLGWRNPEYQALSDQANRLRQLLANEVIATIEAAPMPTTPRIGTRHDGMVKRAAAVRALLKVLGIRGVSVTAPSYSMACSVHVRLPNFRHEHDERHFGQRYRDCTRCQRRHAATERLARLILTAFPDWDDRSDSQADHFDYVVSVS